MSWDLSRDLEYFCKNCVNDLWGLFCLKEGWRVWSMLFGGCKAKRKIIEHFSDIKEKG